MTHTSRTPSARSIRLRPGSVGDAGSAAGRIVLIDAPSPLEPLRRVGAWLDGSPELFVKRDDAIPFGGGGNKVRKLEYVLSAAQADGADTLITTGGMQSNHARATAAAAARLGMGCYIVLNGVPPPHPTGNLRLMQLFGATIEYVAERAERDSAMARAAARLTAEGRRPFVIPLGASTPIGVLGFVRAAQELCLQMEPPEFVVHATSSGGTQAGLLVGFALAGAHTRVIGISADEPACILEAAVSRLIDGARALLGKAGAPLEAHRRIEVDDRFVGAGYGIPTEESRQAQVNLARFEGLLVDPTYTAKAMAALVTYVCEGRFSPGDRVVFWHTGGLPALFA